MKIKTLKLFFSVCLCLVIFFCIFFISYNLIFNKKNKNELLTVANNIINQNIVTNNENANSTDEKEVFSVEELENDKNVIGRLVIDKIDVKAPILDGTSQEILKIAVGHFQSTNYWNGNVCLASHNRGSYAHYFQKINQLSIGDEIKYQTKLGTRIFIVSEVKKIQEYDLSVLDETEENTITLITCVNAHPELRLCIKGIEKI